MLDGAKSNLDNVKTTTDDVGSRKKAKGHTGE